MSIVIEPGSVLVVTEWRDLGDDEPVIRGAWSTLYEFYALLKRLWVYDRDANVLPRKVELRSCYAENMKWEDADKCATSRIVIVRAGEDDDETDFYAWDSAKAKATYEPLKLYWATTEGGEEDWFIVARSSKDAAYEHAAAEAFNPDEPSAEYVMELPAGIEQRFDEEASTPGPDQETLIACGAEFVRDDDTRVVKVAGRTFTEGVMERLMGMARSGKRLEEN